MAQEVRIIEINEGNLRDYAYCGYRNPKQEGYKRKAAWIRKQLPKGLRFKNLYSKKDGVIGSIEYVPGKYTWRPIEAKGYMVIHRILIIHRKHKGKGYGSRLVMEAIKDVKKKKMDGVVVVTSKGTWMAGKELFLKLGFTTVDTAPPSFELEVYKLRKRAINPRFKGRWQKKVDAYSKGLTIIHSDQCPSVAKAMAEIPETAKIQYGKRPRLIELKNARDAQDAPCGFGIFNIIYEGKLVAEHPISNARFRNIMNKEAKRGT